MVSFETVTRIFLSLPGVEAGSSYGTPGFRVRGKFLSRLWEDGEVLVVRVGFEEREILMATDPEVYFITDHYAGYPAVLIRLSAVEEADIRDVLEQAWRQVAPKSLVNAHDKASVS